MELGIDRARRFAPILWSREGSSAVVIARDLGESALTIGNAIETVGFRTVSAVEGRERGRYARGPCLECWRVRPRKQIHDSRGWRCTVCVGQEDVRLALPVDIRRERAEALARMDQDPTRREGLKGRKPHLKKYTKGGA